MKIGEREREREEKRKREKRRKKKGRKKEKSEGKICKHKKLTESESSSINAKAEFINIA